jgi:signal transduction histidine kinase
LDAAVALRHKIGLIMRVKVWTRDGTVVYSDEKDAVGQRYPLDTEVRESIDDGVRTAQISNLDADENVTETGMADRLVEVYTPLTLSDGRQLAFELYMSDASVRTEEHRLIAHTVPLSLLALLVLVVLQLPLSVWLVRRVGRGSAERAELLRRVLTVSDNERRIVAHDLHDGAVQDLAGAGFALNSLTSRLPAGADDEAARLLNRVSDAVHHAIRSLRTLVVDIYPPDLGVKGMQGAFDDLAQPLRDAGVDMRVEVDAGAASTDVATDVSAMLYRCARECLINVAKHAQAQQASVSLAAAGATLVLTVDDDGVGLPPTGIDRRREGHLGLRLLADAVAGMGGRLLAASGPLGGTRIVVELPRDSAVGL